MTLDGSSVSTSTRTDGGPTNPDEPSPDYPLGLETGIRVGNSSSNRLYILSLRLRINDTDTLRDMILTQGP